MAHKIKILDMTGKKVGEKEVSWLETEKGDEAIYLTITAFRAGQRRGTACAKTRSEVSLTGKKPWKQKGTGRARAGTASSPIWKGGGVTFAPKPRLFKKKVNKKVTQLALRRAFTKQFEADNVLLINEIEFKEFKTKVAADFLDKLGANNRAIVVLDDSLWSESLEKTERSFWNLPSALVIGANELNTYDILLGKKIVITEKAFDIITQRATRTFKKKVVQNA